MRSRFALICRKGRIKVTIPVAAVNLSLRNGAKIALLLSAVLLLPTKRSFALDPSRALTQYIQHVWRSEDGLPQNTVESVLQTRDGYIWIATDGGLVRFDGVQFTVFDKRNTALKSSSIISLVEDGQGTLWLTTYGGGVAHYQNGKFQVYTTRDGLSSDLTTAMCRDREGGVWIGTERGLDLFDKQKFVSYTTADGLPDNRVRALFQDVSGALWIGTADGGLAEFRNGKFKIYTKKDGLSDLQINVISGDHDGNLWIGTEAGGLNLFRDGKFRSYTTKDGLSDDSVRAILKDREGSLWIGTRNGGLNRIIDGTFSSLNTKEGLSHEFVRCLFEDREGSLWIGTSEGGLDRLQDSKFTLYGKNEGLSSDLVFCVYQDREGTLWIGTMGGGLNRFKDGKFVHYTAKDGLAGNVVRSLFEDSEGNLWIGTAGGGLSRYRNGVFTTVNSRNGISNDVVASISEDREHNLWIGTLSGLNRFKNGKFTVYTTKDGLTNDSVRDIHQDRNGVLWFATAGGGLIRLQDGKFRSYTTRDGLSDNIVYSIHEDAQGSLWIGTGDGGLTRFRDGKFTSWNEKQGLFDDQAFQILEDDRGTLWMSSNNGIYSVNKEDLEAYATAKTRLLKSVGYGEEDGMRSRECNGGTQPAGWRTRDGRLWFPTIKGLVMIDSAHIKTNLLPPPVVVGDVVVDDQKIEERNGSSSPIVSLPPGKDKFEFHYAALSFLAPQKVRFKYKLEGYDQAWINADTRRVAYYTRIPPRSYRFRVIACNNDGIWNETGASFNFVLQPYFYQTRWFYFFCAGVAGLIAWSAYRLRLQQVSARFSAVLQERNRMAREIHDTLAQSLTGISLQLEGARETLRSEPEQAVEHLTLAKGLVRSGLSETRRLVWDLRSQSPDSDLTSAIRNMAGGLAASANLEVKVEVRGNPRKIDGAIESHLLRIVQEAITNAVKHAHAGKMLVELTFDSGEIGLRLKDNGCGFDAQAPRSPRAGKFGLIGMQERVEKMRGTLTITSSHNAGTDIAIRVPSNSHE